MAVGGQFREPEQPAHGSALESEGRHGCPVPSTSPSIPSAPEPSPQRLIEARGIGSRLGDRIRIQGPS